MLKGFKEARWNNKYMKIIEKPVVQIQQATQLIDIQTVVSALLKSLHNIFQTSNFYKEVRIVSFVDKLVATLIKKVQQTQNIQAAVK